MLHITMLSAVQLICALGIKILKKRVTVMFYRIMSFCMGSVSVVGHHCCTYNEMCPEMLSCSYVPKVLHNLPFT